MEDFTIKKLIGKGASGKIYLAEKNSNKKIFAIKSQNKMDILKKNNLEKIQIEKQILAQFNHPLLVKLHYSFQNEKKLFFVMDLIRGGDLFSHLKKIKRFSEE